MIIRPNGCSYFNWCFRDAIPIYSKNRFLGEIRSFSHIYSPLIKRNRVPYINFETGAPRPIIRESSLTTPFTLSKQRKLQTQLRQSPVKIFNGRVIRQLSAIKVRMSGRNDTGRKVVRHKGGGHRQRIRFVDFKRARKDIYARVLRIEYCPGRTAHVALIQYSDGVLSYILAPVTLRPGDVVISSEKAAIAPGNSLPLKRIPIGTIIHSIEIRPGIGGALHRAAGTYGVVKSKTETTAIVKLNSTEIRAFDLRCWAVVGQVGNLDHRLLPRGKAGASRWLGITPKVRGIVMNPNQHPHGGGNGAKHLCQPTKSLWGVRTFQRKTRSQRPLGMIYKRKLNGRQNKKYGIARG